MRKYRTTFGVDISKATFDVCSSAGTYDQFTNDLAGFRQFLKFVTKRSIVVMEATGCYHFKLAQFLHSRKRTVSVVNPLCVKRFIQMKFSKMKTDKADAKMICKYAMQNETPIYNFKTKIQSECVQLLSAIEIYKK